MNPKHFLTELEEHNAAGASEALTEERENSLRLAFGKSWDEIKSEKALRLAIDFAVENWPNDLEAAVELVLERVAEGGRP